MENFPSRKQTLELWTNEEHSDFSLSVVTIEHEDNNPKRELIIATDLDANFTNKIGEIESVDVNRNPMQQYNWQNILEEWISNSNAIPNSKRTPVLLEIGNGRVAVHQYFKYEEIQNNMVKSQKQRGKASKATSIKCKICNLSFTNF